MIIDGHEVYEYTKSEIVPLPAICTGKYHKHEWLDTNGNGAIRAPSLRNCVCFWCGKPLKPHPDYPHVIDAETRRKMQYRQSVLIVPHVATIATAD